MDDWKREAMARFRQVTFTSVSITESAKAEKQVTTTPSVEKTNAYLCKPVCLEDAKNFVDRLKLAYPNDTFLATSHCGSSFRGYLLLYTPQSHVYKLGNRATSPTTSDDELKSKAFVWVFETKAMTKYKERSEFIREKVESLYSGYYASVFVGDYLQYYFSGSYKASAYFDQSSGYGQSVLIVLI